MNAQFKKGALDVCVLSLLADGDKYGYELTQAISDTMTIASGTLYPILRKLKDEDYVTTYLVDSGSGPARKYYSLTEKGREKQKKEKKEWEEFTLAIQKIIKGAENEET